MKKVIMQLSSLLACTATGLLLMGAGPLKSTVTTSVPTTSLASKPTSSVTTSVITKSTASSKPGLSSGPTASAPFALSSKPTSSITTSMVSKPTCSLTLSPYAEELARIVRFDRQVFLVVKEVTHERIHRLIGYDADGYQIIAPAIAVPVPEDQVDRVLATLRQKLLPLKYMPFVVEINAGIKIDTIGILKGTDQYEVLRVMHTDGDDYEISNQDVIDRLKDWERTAPFDIIGADGDWVEIEFRTLPKNLKAFVEEVADFCPDAIDRGPGSIDGLVAELKKTNRLFLWWD